MTSSEKAHAMPPQRLHEGVRPREVFGWAMYDFANSGYTTVVITAVFNAYFVSVVAGNAAWATFAWTATLALSYAAIVLTAPLAGAWADIHAAKKRLLAASTLGCVAATAALAMVGPGDLVLAIVLVAVSNFFFGSGENIAAAFLPELARGESLGRVSGWGWSVGYLGGLTALGLSLVYVTWAQARGQDAASFVPVTALITAALFALASVPTFAWLRERSVPLRELARRNPESRLFDAESPGRDARPGAVRAAYARVAHTLRHARQYRDLRRLLVCMVFYQAGIQTVIALAAIYAQQALGFETADTLRLILVVNVTAAAGAFVFGAVQDRLGHVRTLALTLAGWILTVLIAWAAQGPAAFWVAANIAGLCMGASQSAGRALVGFFSPEDRRAEFFGLWGLAVKLSSILGPLTYGAVTWTSGGNHRLAILATGAFFVVGLAILAGVDAQRGREAALGATSSPVNGPGSRRGAGLGIVTIRLTSKLPQVGTTIFTLMSQLAAEHGAVNLGQGFPDFDPDPRLQALVSEAMRKGHNQYAPLAGVPVLLEAIAAKVERLYGRAYDPGTEITVTAGATEALMTAVLAAVHPGDEVIVLEPAFDSYVPAIRLAGGRPVLVPLAAGNYAVPWDRVRSAITARTRLLMLNFPHNPSGAVLSEADLDALESVLRGSDAMLLSDEVYEHMVFDGQPCRSVARRPALAERAFVVSSFAKTLHATGWKIGYVLAPRELTEEFRRIHQFVVFAVFTPGQHAIAAWLRDPAVYESLPAFYQEKRDRFRAGLAGSRLRLLPCPGTFYQLVDYSGLGSAFGEETEAAFARRLTTQIGVAAIPVSALYEQPVERKVVRFCFAKKPQTLDRAIERLARI